MLPTLFSTLLSIATLFGALAPLPPAPAPNDPYWSKQVNLGPSNSYGINLLRAWPYSRGAGVVIAVVDSGYVSHPEFSGRVLPGYDFITDPARARDGDGRDAIPRDEGDWVTQAEIDSGEVDADCEAETSSWHGTFVASIALAAANNTVGIVGIAPEAKLLPVRALGRCGGTDRDIADAIRWAAGGEVSGVPANEHPADIINLSLAGDGPCSSPIAGAIQEALDLGAAVVVAAGNDSVDAASHGPANCDGVITVAAVDRYGRRTDYSDFGDVVRVAAPGGAFPTGVIGSSNFGETVPLRSGYASGAGTSFAAPHVAGILALARSFDRTTPAPELAALLQMSATPFPLDPSTGLPWAGDCDEGRCGAGIANAGAMLALMAARPKPTVQFSAPESLAIGLDGGESAPVSATSGADGTALVVLAVVSTSTCSFTDGIVTALTAASCRLRATVSGTRDAAPGSVDLVLNQVGLSSELTARITAKIRLGRSAAATIAAASSGAWKAKSLTPKTCKILGRRTVMAIGLGTCSVKVSIPVAGPYEAASKTLKITITR
ncbi:MAG: hypothetical protein RIR19_159 [Chloroflexota bacterium]|jgi:hypothetical protein